MDKRTCDILVVGSGPAGASVALAAARRGIRVLMVERRQTVGVPVQCAEYIPAMLVGRLQLGRAFVVQSVRGMKTHLPGEPARVTAAPGFIIRRDLFDQTLARAAIDAGAELLRCTRALRRVDDKTVLLKRKSGPHITVESKIIVGADGPRSTVGRWVGAVNRNLLPGVQATLPLCTPLHDTEIYFDPGIYAGYGWLFPKQSVANVGLGLKKTARNRVVLGEALKIFIARLKADGKVKGDAVAHTAGWIPAEPVRPAVYGNVALVGDAAGHTHPITGAGIFTAVSGGEIAGKWAARAVEENDLELLKTYDHKWRDLFEDTLQRAHQRRKMMESCWHDFVPTVKTCWIAFRKYYE
jgi:geranylgeranyl reductase family protein